MTGASFAKTQFLDNSFATGGIAIKTVGVSIASANSMVFQPKGKILLGGFSLTGANRCFTLVRFDSTGGIDSGFGTGGVVTTVFTGGASEIASIALQEDGRIVAVGKGPAVNVGSPKAGNPISMRINKMDGKTILRYGIGKAGRISLDLYNGKGKAIRSLLSGTRQTAGRHELAIDLPKASSPGRYYLVLSSPTGKASVEILK